MKVVLLQDEIYLPSFGGGVKANRLLLEGMAGRGHQCLAFARAVTRSPDGPADEAGFRRHMAFRGIDTRMSAPGVYTYEYNGVRVEAIGAMDLDERREKLSQRISESQADLVLVADDKRRFILDAALAVAPGRVVCLIQTVVWLPFGPLAQDKSDSQLELMEKVRSILVISEFAREYVRKHSELDSELVRLPVYGQGPFPLLGNMNNEFVTLVNPCEQKGLSVFCALAEKHTEVAFAAVPTWGADDEILRRLNAMENVHILDADDNIEKILRRTRILLAPSLWPETFGYIVPEAMLRGIPVISSNAGGLPEAKLGVDFVLPVVQAGGDKRRAENIEVWSRALQSLLNDPEAYHRCSRESREAALKFVAGCDVARAEAILENLVSSPVQA